MRNRRMGGRDGFRGRDGGRLGDSSPTRDLPEYDSDYSVRVESDQFGQHSVPLETICQWQHCMDWWMTAYRGGLLTHNAQIYVRNYSSKKYKSHRCVPETVARHFNAWKYFKDLAKDAVSLFGSLLIMPPIRHHPKYISPSVLTQLKIHLKVLFLW